MNDNYFQQLYDVNLEGKIKQKNGLNYVSWSVAWAEVKKRHPNAVYTDYQSPEHYTEETTSSFDDKGNITTQTFQKVYYPPRFWFDDGNTGWVKVGVTIDGIEHIENFPIMDNRNKAIPANQITSTDANKAKMRALAKACGKHGLGLYIYEGEDVPEATKTQKNELDKARKTVVSLCRKRAEEDGVNKETIYKVIESLNGGNRQPNSIPTVELCEIIQKAVMDIPAPSVKERK